MKVTVYLGEPYWRTAGQRELGLALPAGASVADALAEMTRLCPALKGEMWNREALPLVFVDDSEAQLANPLVDGAKLHVVWPVSGG